MGWQASKGDWVQFLDADDLFYPQKVSHQVALIEASHTTPSFIAAATMERAAHEEREQPWPVHEPIWHGLLTNRAGNTVVNLFSKAALEAVDGWDTSLKSCQEYDLLFRILQWNEAVLIDTEASHMLIRQRASGSISSADQWGNQQRFLSLMARICRYLKRERPDIFNSLPQVFFEDMYQRIRLNTIHGQVGSASIYKGIMPVGFKPRHRPYDSRAFRTLMNLFGFSFADQIQGLFKKALS
jgi:glycosyltransferase involved in cell wall biosynthesis